MGVFFSFHTRFIDWNIMRWGGNISSVCEQFISLSFLKWVQRWTVDWFSYSWAVYARCFVYLHCTIWQILTVKYSENWFEHNFSHLLSNSVDHPISLITWSWKFLDLICTKNDNIAKHLMKHILKSIMKHKHIISNLTHWRFKWEAILTYPYASSIPQESPVERHSLACWILK